MLLPGPPHRSLEGPFAPSRAAPDKQLKATQNDALSRTERVAGRQVGPFKALAVPAQPSKGCARLSVRQRRALTQSRSCVPLLILWFRSFIMLSWASGLACCAFGGCKKLPVRHDTAFHGPYTVRRCSGGAHAVFQVWC